MAKSGPKPGSRTADTVLYKKLRAKLVEIDMRAREYSLLIHRSHAYVSARMNGKAAWDTDDIYNSCDVLGILHDEIHLYFPKGGINEPQSLALSGNSPKQSTYKPSKREKEVLMEKLMTIEEYVHFRKSNEQINEFEINKRSENARHIIGFVLDYFLG